MAILDEATSALREIETELLKPTQGGLDSVHLAERLRAVRKLLSKDEARWVGTTEAKRLLGLGSENTVKAWARIGLLRSRTQPTGRIQVLLDDVLRRREEREGLSAIDGDEEISTEEALRLLRPRLGHASRGHEQADSTR
jgi:hypothetical protein